MLYVLFTILLNIKIPVVKILSIVIIFLIFFTPVIHAQKGLPAVGKIDKADLEMKDCDFDKGADAVKLIDWGNIFYRRGKDLFNTIYERRVRIKILKEAALNYANVSIPYYDENNEEQIKKISAYSFNLDDAGNIKITEVGKSSIYTKRINKQHSEMIIAFPEAKVGSVIEYKYTMERETMNDIKDWYFQGKIPTRYSEYQLNIPLIFRFAVQPSVVDELETKDEIYEERIAVGGDGASSIIQAKAIRKNYIMRHLPGIKTEPYMGSPFDYMQRLEFQLSQIDFGDGDVRDIRKTWNDLLKNLMESEDFGLQLDKKISGTEDLIVQAALLTDPENKIRSVYDFVRKNMNWNERETIFSDEGIINAWKNRAGSSADINILLANLLRKAGIQAYPVLFSTRENGLVNANYPFISQFNTVMAYVKLGEKFFILDATDKYASFRLTPEVIVNTRGFVVEGEKGKWVEAKDITHKYKVMSAVHGVIDENGVMKGDAVVNCSSYAKGKRCISWVQDNEKFKQAYFVKPYTSLQIDQLVVKNAEYDSLPLEQKVNFNYTLGNSGGYRNFTVNLFSDLETNPFIADERQSDIDFGVLKDYMIFGNYTIPEGYSFEALPENLSMIMPDTSISFTRFLSAEANLLNVRISVSFKNTYYPVSVYPDFAAFYKKMMAKLNEPIVIKRKTTP